MKKIIYLFITIFMFSNSFSMEGDVPELKDRIPKEEYQKLQRKEDILKDAKYMSQQELREKYTEDEIEYLYRVSENFTSKELNLPSSLKEGKLDE